MRLLILVALTYATMLALAALKPVATPALGTGPAVVDPVVPHGLHAGDAHDDAASWWREARPHCNAVEVRAYLAAHPAPGDFLGLAYSATCRALAGDLEAARAMIDALPAAERWRAAGVVFDVVHPAADAGDELAAGPVMELVVDYWPNHYMALYHAGAARFERQEFDAACDYLRRFLDVYETDDGWRRSALDMLDRAPAC